MRELLIFISAMLLSNAAIAQTASENYLKALVAYNAKNFIEAISCYQKASNQGYAEAQYNLGVCYYKGEGVVKDIKKAVYWYEKAAAQGVDDAKKGVVRCQNYSDNEKTK